MWTELLGAEAIGVEDSFFALGGDSLLALRFLARLREEVGVEYSIARLFEQPQLSALAADVNRLQGTGEPPPGRDEIVI
jgi:arthrofactin-type cyclic lipopeptide synthetase C